MDYVNRIALTILYTMVTVIAFSSVMTFINVEPAVYNPYMYFFLMLIFFQLIIT